jgi:hypothetical protein
MGAARPVVAPRIIAGDRCQACGAVGSVGDVDFRQNIGLLVLRLSKQVKGRLCPRCASGQFWQLTLITLIGGWWGLISFFVTPFFLLNNLISYASYRPSGTTGSAARPGLVPVGILVGGAGLLALVVVGGFALLVASIGSLDSGRRADPRAALFDEANAKIVTATDGTAFGNTAEATVLAERYGRTMEALAELAFTGGGKKDAPSLTNGHFLTYCELRADRICFLVHVPDLRAYKGDVRLELLKLAWTTAKTVTAVERREKDRRLGVGLRGFVAYGAIATGMGEGTPVNATDEILDEAKLYDFFVPSGGAAPARRSNPYAGILELVPKKAVAFHVGGGRAVTCADYGAAEGRAHVAAVDLPSGIALVQLENMNWGAVGEGPLTLGVSKDLTTKDRLHTVIPLSAGGTQLFGAFKGSAIENGITYLDVDIRLAAALAGTPVLDESDRVVAIALRNPDATGTRFVAVEHIRALLARTAPPPAR